MVFEVSLDVDEADVAGHDTTDLDENFAFMVSSAKRRTEAHLRHMTPEERKMMSEAKDKEIDQWVHNSVFSIARRCGIPEHRIMSMRWVLSWKTIEPTPEDPEGGTKAKARLVVRGFEDPDLTTVRAESPTLSRFGRHMLLQLVASNKLLLEFGDVKTAFLQGDKAEATRDVYVDPTAEVRALLGISKEELLRLEGSVYGLRTAPRRWWQRVKNDLTGLGFRTHQLDQCVFMYYGKSGDLIGIIGVYVDDFIVAGKEHDDEWQAIRQKVLDLYTWGSWKTRQFKLCGVEYQQKRDYSVHLSMTEYVEELDTYSLPRYNNNKGGLASNEMQRVMRSGNGSLQ